MCTGCLLLSDFCTFLSQSCFDHVSLVNLEQPMSAQILKLMTASSVTPFNIGHQTSPGLFIWSLIFLVPSATFDRHFSSIYINPLQSILLFLEPVFINMYMYSSIKRTLKCKFVISDIQNTGSSI